MAMGSTGTVNITPDMMKNALNVIEEYRKKTTNLAKELSNTMTSLASSFSGSAASGFKTFYENNIVPAVDEGLTGLLNALETIINETLKAIPAESVGLDDTLGEGNKQ